MNLLLRVIMSLMCLLYVSTREASAATYYLSPTGSDTNPGSENQPLKTLSAAVQKTVDGDTISVKSGTYDLARTAILISKAISIIGENKDTTIFTNGVGITFQKSFTAKNLSFVNFDKSSATNAVFKPKPVTGGVMDGVYIENIKVDAAVGVIYGRGNPGTIKNFYVSNSSFSNIGSSFSTQVISLSEGNISNITIKDNVFDNIFTTTNTNEAYGIIIGKDEYTPTPTYITVTNNRIHRLVGGTEQRSAGVPAAARGILIYGDHNVVSYNTVAEVNQAPAHTAIYLKGSNLLIAHNVVHNGGTAQFPGESYSSADITIKGTDNVNNRIYGNKITSDEKMSNGGCGIVTKGGVTIENNYIKKMYGEGIHSWDLANKTMIVKNNNVEARDSAINIWEANLGEISGNRIVSYEGKPIYLANSTLRDTNNTKCSGTSCSISIPNPSCQNQGLLCCAACAGTGNSSLNGSCESGRFCCNACNNQTIATPAPTKSGDANKDGTVNEADYSIWKSIYLGENTYSQNQGNFNNDTNVDGLDYVIWLKSTQ